MKPEPVRITVANRTIFRILAIILASYIAIRFVIKVDHVIELIFLSFFLSLALNPAIRWIAHFLRIKSRIAATAIAYILVIVVLGIFVALVVPPLVRQTINFAHDLPGTLNNLKESSSPAGHFVKHYHLQKQFNNLSKYLKAHVGNLKQPVISTATKLGDAVVSTIVVFVLTFMMLTEGPYWIDRLSKLKPLANKGWHSEMFAKMYKIITGYVYGQVLLALIGGGVSLVALFITSTLLNVSINDVALAGIILITGLVPMIGHIIGGSIVVVACLFVSWPLAIIIGIFLVIYQEIESVTLQPYIQAKYNELTPLLVFCAALVGIAAGGLIGAFVAIPLAGCLRVAFKQYVKHQNNILNSI